MSASDTSRTQVWVLVIAAVASFMAALDTLVVTTALTTIRLDLGASIEQLEWTVNAYNLSFAVLLMTAAALGDRFGRRRMFAAGLGLFSVASAACALAPDVGWLIAARAVQGVGAAIVTTLALALVSTAFSPERRGAALGIFFAVTGLAVASGPLVGGAIAEGIAWQWIFWLNVPIGLALVPLALRRMPESFGPDSGSTSAGWRSSPRARSARLGTRARQHRRLGQLRGRRNARRRPGARRRLRRLGAAGARADAADALLPLARVLGRATRRSSSPSRRSSAASSSLPSSCRPRSARARSRPGLRLLPWTATLFFVAPVAGALVDRYGERPFLVARAAAAGGRHGLDRADRGSGDGLRRDDPAADVAGVGVSMSFPAAQNSVVGSVPEAAIGKASGVNTTMRELGGVFGIALSVAVFAGAGSYASAEAFSDGFVAAMALSAGLSLTSAICGAFLPGRQAREPGVAPTAVPALESEGG